MKATERIKVGRGVAVFLRWRKWWVDLYQRGSRVQYSLGTEDQGEAVSAGVAILRDIESRKSNIKERPMANKRRPVSGPDQKPLWRRSLDEMDLTETTDWALGQLSIALGRGDFRTALCGIVSGMMHAHFERGVTAGIKREKERHAEAQRLKLARRSKK